MNNTDWAWPWWSAIVIINAINLIICAIVFRNSLKPGNGEDKKYRNWMRIMGVIFTLVGAYRSIFVSRYLSQMAWFDTIANSSLLIRTFAIFAELSFAGLIAFAMLRVNKDLPAQIYSNSNRFRLFLTTKSPYILMASIFLAQFFATSGLIYKNKTLFAIEETFWTIGFLSVIPLAILQYRRVHSVKDTKTIARLSMLRKSTKLIVIWCIIYSSYGLFYHLPFENWAGAFDQMETGLPVIKTGISAISDAFTIVNESKEYSDWGFGFLLWHSAYFSICVWIAIALMRAPRIKNLAV